MQLGPKTKSMIIAMLSLSMAWDEAIGASSSPPSSPSHSCEYQNAVTRLEMGLETHRVKMQGILDQVHLDNGLKWEVVDSDNRRELETVFQLYRQTYADLGVVIPSFEKLMASRIAAVVRDANGEIETYLLARMDRFGLLITQIGAKPNRTGLQILSQTLKGELPEGLYCQTSGAPLNALRKTGKTPVVSFEKAQAIREDREHPIRKPTDDELKREVEQGHLPNDPEVLKNAFYITFAVQNELKSVIKVMMGKPWAVPR
jgi:hypothetical protein